MPAGWPVTPACVQNGAVTRNHLALAMAALVILACACSESGGPSGSPAPLAVTVTAGSTASPAPSGPPPESPSETKRPGAHVSLEWLDGDGVVPDLPFPFAPAVPDPSLAGEIQRALLGVEGDVSVVVHNLADGRWAAYNESQVYYAASTYKMSLLYEAYRQVEAGERALSDVLTLEEKYAEYDLGTLDYLGLHAGDTLTLQDALRAMIVVSDTPTAVLLQDTLGAARVDETLRFLGLMDTEFNNQDLPATAADMARLLEAIAAGEGVGDASRLAMLSLLMQEEITGGVVSAVPPGTPVAHKSGNLGTYNHDIALVWGPAGPYVIAVMTDTDLGWDPVLAVASAVWRYFEENRGSFSQ